MVFLYSFFFLSWDAINFIDLKSDLFFTGRMCYDCGLNIDIWGATKNHPLLIQFSRHSSNIDFTKFINK